MVATTNPRLDSSWVLDAEPQPTARKVVVVATPLPLLAACSQLCENQPMIVKRPFRTNEFTERPARTRQERNCIPTSRR